VFLSHATPDKKCADKIAGVLRKHGVPVWYSRTHLRGAQQWQAEIGNALRRCDWFIVILSPAAVKSMWVKRELSYALIQPRYEDRIIPLLLRRCDYERLHWTLAGFQMVKLTGGFASGCRNCCASGISATTRSVSSGGYRPWPLRSKICGLTNVGDARAALELGADYLGFVFYPKSPRAVTATQLARLLDKLDRPSRAVGVFVNTPRAEVEQIAADCGLYAVQIHGDEPAAEFTALPVRVWRAVRREQEAWTPARRLGRPSVTSWTRPRPDSMAGAEQPPTGARRPRWPRAGRSCSRAA